MASSINGDPSRPAILERALSRGDLIVGGALAAAAGLAWWWLAAAPMPGHDGGEMGMMAVDAGIWSSSYLFPAFLMWSLMMVAMMLPSAAPMILLHGRVARHNRSGLAGTWIFALAYLAVWALFSAVAAVAQAMLIDAGLVSAMSLSFGSRAAAATLLVLAALYQLTPIKNACLARCRSPLAFVMQRWRPGAAGALRAGLAHGLYCLGCCWVVMLLLFVGGVMNVAWVAVLAAIVLAEKLAPPMWRISWLVAALFLILSQAVLAEPFQARWIGLASSRGIEAAPGTGRVGDAGSFLFGLP